MLKLYCQNCGALNAYVSEKPNFCQKCGAPTNGAKANEQQVPPPAIEEDIQQLSSKVNEDIDIPDLSGMGLQVDIDMRSYQKTSTVADLAGTEATGNDDMTTFINPEEGGDYTMEDFEREAGSIKNNEKKKT